MEKKIKKYAAVAVCAVLLTSLSTVAFADDYYYQDYNDDYSYGDTYDGYEVYYGDSDSTDGYYQDDNYTDYYQDDTSSDYTDYYQDTTTDSSDTTDYYQDTTSSDSSTSYGTDTTDSTTTTQGTDGTTTTDSTDSSSSSSSSSGSSGKTASTTPTPNISVPSPGTNFYILDQAGVIESDVVKSIESQGEQLYKDTGAQVVVVTIKSAGVNLKDYAYTLFNKWNIGGDNGYGVLVLLSTDEKLYYTMSGKGLMNSVDNTVLSNLNTTYLEPSFAEGKYSDGVNAIYPQIVTKVKAYMERSGNAVAQTVTSSATSEVSDASAASAAADSSSTNTNAKAVLSVILKIFIFILIILALIVGVFVWRRFQLKKLAEAKRKQQQSKNRKPQNSSAKSGSSSRNQRSGSSGSSSASRRANRKTPPPSAPIKPRRNK